MGQSERADSGVVTVAWCPEHGPVGGERTRFCEPCAVVDDFPTLERRRMVAVDELLAEDPVATLDRYHQALEAITEIQCPIQNDAVIVREQLRSAQHVAREALR